MDVATTNGPDGKTRLSTVHHLQHSHHLLLITSSIALALAISILVLDLMLPLGVAGGVPYVALVLVGWWFPRREMIFVLALISTVLTVVGYFHSPEGGIPWVVLTNRAYALFAIWVTAIAIWVARRSKALVLQSEASLRQSMQKAEAANVAKTEFLATVSHELRTPLNAINGFTDSILHETFGPIANDKYKEYIEDIQHSGNHLNELIIDLLDVSAIEAGKLELNEEELDVKEQIEHSIRLISPRAKRRNVSFRVSVSDTMPTLYADSRRLKEILLNILSNAVKFSHEGGEVSLEAQFNSGGWVAITVSDNGIGMNEIELVKAMEKFGQVENQNTRKFEGTGLGLPLSKALMELHGGNLEISSEKGVGTTVTATFPNKQVAYQAS